MGYFYDLHVHSKECSGCAATSAADMVIASKNAGYSGFVLTNHFLSGNNCVPKELPWEERVAYYWNAYLEAKRVGDEVDFDVFFGIEHHYGYAREILIYGIDYDFLAAIPDFCNLPAEEICERVHKVGGFVSHAHPFRERGYIPVGDYNMDYSYLDAIEILNSANREIEDLRAKELQESLGLAFTAGNDLHYAPHLESFPKSGIVFDKRLRTNEELLAALRARVGAPKYSGDRYYK